jgi:hypothetical protein
VNRFIEGILDFGKCIAAVINTAVLATAYLLGVGITSVVARITGKKFLDIGKKRTYWKKFSKSDARRQF